MFQIIHQHPALFGVLEFFTLAFLCLWLAACIKQKQLQLLMDEDRKPGLEAFTLAQYRAAYKIALERKETRP